MKSVRTVSLLVASVACFMVILDTTVVNVAVDGIRTGLHAQLSGLQWVIDGYTLSFAALLLSAGAITDRIGPTRTLTVGLVIFTVASLFCGLAPSLEVLVTARIVQGIGAALLIPSSLALISRTFTEQHERAKALSIWGGIGGGTAITTGPVIGGLLIGAFGWGSVFLINVPVGLLALFLILKVVPKMEGPEEKRSLDLPGQISAVVALASATYFFIEGPHAGWGSPIALTSFVVMIVAAVAFLRIEKRTPEPMMPLEMFKSRALSAATAVGFTLNFAFYAQLFFLNLFLQEHLHYSPGQTGLHFLPQSIAGMTFALSIGRLSRKIPPATAIVLGTASSALGLTLLGAVGVGTSVWTDVLAFALIGVGIGTPASLMAVALSSVDGSHSGLAAGAINAARQSGGLLGVAVLGSLVGGRDMVGEIHVALWVAAAIMGVGALTAASIRQKREEPSLELSETLAEAIA